MEIKDWIMLMVPIVFDGIILVVFGKYYEKRLERKNEKERKIKKIEDGFYDLLIQTRSCFYEMKSKMVINVSQEKLKYAMNQFCFSCDELHKYIIEYDFILHQYDIIVKDIITNYSDMILGIRNIFLETTINYDDLNSLGNKKISNIEEGLNKMIKMYLK